MKASMIFMVILVCGFSLRAQRNVITINADSLKQRTSVLLSKAGWVWNNADNPTFRNPSFSDSGWAYANPVFGEGRELDGWNGIGWFRLYIRIDSSLADKTLALQLNHDGASEVFWNGKKVAGYGKVGRSKTDMVPERITYQVIPLDVTDTLPHLLAIRYSNYNSYYDDFIGFQAWVGDYERMNASRHQKLEKNDWLLASVAAQLMLVLLHFFMFLFYPRQKLNLYYSLFVLSSALVMFAKYLYVATTNPRVQTFSDSLFLASLQALTVFLALFIYNITKPSHYRLRMIVVSTVCAVITIWMVFINESSEYGFNATLWIAGNVFFIIVVADGVAGLVRSIRRRQPGLWLIALGVVLIASFSMFIGTGWFGLFFGNQPDLLLVMGVGTLVLPVCFSLYLAMDIARTNRNLEKELVLNEQLSATNLQQEQERTRIIAGQAEQLERTVAERTAKIREQSDRLVEMDAVKSRFFVNLTHEFRTPLSLILGPAQQILDKTKEQAIRFQASLIRDNAARLLALINQLLDLSKLEAGKMAVDEQAVDLVRLISNLIASYDPLTSSKKISIIFNNGLQSLWIMTDRNKMEMILHNIVSNAVKFSNDGGLLQVSLALQHDQLEMSVKDDGIGISPNKLPYIFDRFYQVDSSDTRKQEGTGIGLALTKELVELMHGNITVQSEPGKGTTVVVRLPYVASAAIADADSETNITPQVPQESETQALAESGSLPLVLIVEDNPELRAFVRSVLEDQFSIIEAANGLEGVKLARTRVPDLVITDLMMPEMDGHQVSKQLKKYEPTSHIPVLILTAKTDPGSKIEGWESGADGYISKPFEQQELIALANNLLITRRRLAEKFQGELSAEAPSTLPSMEQVFLERVREVILESIEDEQLGVDFLAGKLGLSRTQLHRKMKALVNQSPGEMIRLIRLQKAMDLLKQRAGTVSEISYMVGFGNPANFSTSFSRHFGIAPSEVK